MNPKFCKICLVHYTVMFYELQGNAVNKRDCKQQKICGARCKCMSNFRENYDRGQVEKKRR
jgi:hypothetical protein